MLGKTDYTIRNTQDLVDQLQGVKIADDEILVSFDVMSLYTNIPIDETLVIIKKKLDVDSSLSERTSLTAASICDLLSLCLKTTNFRFRDTFYELTDGVAMGSPVSAIVANLFNGAFRELCPREVKYQAFTVETLCR